MKQHSSVFNLLITIFMLLALLVTFTFSLLVPEIKRYKTLENALQKSSENISKLQMQYDKRLDRFTMLQYSNNKTLDAQTSRFDAAAFTFEHNDTLHHLRLDIGNNIYFHDDFSIREANITAFLDSPEDFYTFSQKLNQGNWLIGIKDPIIFERDHHKIRTNFSIHIYTAD